MPLPKSCSVLVVSHHLNGFLRATARGLVASLCRPWGSSRFLRDSRNLRIPRDADHPSKNSPDPPWAPRSPGAVAPLMFLLDSPEFSTAPPFPAPQLESGSSRLPPSRRFPSNRSVTPSSVSERRRPVLPGLLSPLRGPSEPVAVCAASSPRLGNRRSHRPCLSSELEGPDWRSARFVGYSVGEPMLRPP